MRSLSEMNILLRNAGRTSKATQWQRFFGRRAMHYKLLNEAPSGASMGEIKNDREQDESLEVYGERSIEEFAQILKPNQLYLYTDRSSLKYGILYPGHIVSFLTDKEADIIDESCVSLRRQKEKKKDVALKFSLSHDDSEKRHRTNPIWDVRFLNVKGEFKEFLYDRAKEGLSPDKDVRRFLTSIPLSELPYSADEMVEYIKDLKQKSANSEYILTDGKRISIFDEEVIEPVSAFNCITGVYRGLSVKGTEPSPSTQMATSSILKLVLGEKERDELIRGTGLRREDDEKRHDQDDELSWTDSIRGFKM